MITTADKLNMVVWAFILFSVLVILWVVFSWHRKWGADLKYVPQIAAILIVLAGMAALADAYWIEPTWLKTEEVVIQDPIPGGVR